MGTVYAISNALVVTDTDDIIDAAIRARRMWNERHPGYVMPEGHLDHNTRCVWFPRPGHAARAATPAGDVVALTCAECQTFLGAGEYRFCDNCLTVKAARCRGCRVPFEPDGEQYCKSCRNTEFLEGMAP